MFCYDFYAELLAQFQHCGYTSAFFDSNTYSEEGILFLRHDIDVDIFGAIGLAEVEEANGFRSTFFIQPDNDFYNPLCAQVRQIVHRLVAMGCRVGLHIDASVFGSADELCADIQQTFAYLSARLPITRAISFHRPAPFLLQQSTTVSGFSSAYEHRFFKAIHYFSDSNRKVFWGKELEDAMADGRSVQLLTHPVWWGEFEASAYEVYQNIARKYQASVDSGLARNIRLFAKIMRSWQVEIP